MFEENEALEDAVYAVKATVDDIDAVTVLLGNDLANKEGERIPEVGMLLNFCSGHHGFVSRQVAVRLLNDGSLLA